MKYLIPANDTGSLSFKPFFIIINDDDHNTVTHKAVKMLFNLLL